MGIYVTSDDWNYPAVIDLFNNTTYVMWDTGLFPINLKINIYSDNVKRKIKSYCEDTLDGVSFLMEEIHGFRKRIASTYQRK